MTKLDSNLIGRALFNIQRFQVLQAKLNPQTSSKIPDAYAYAWEEEIFPFLDDSNLHYDFENFFSITSRQVDIITKYADDEWLKKRIYTFYEYEDHFSSRTNPVEGINRVVLIRVFRYSYLRGGFDDAFWAKLLEPMKHPSEASTITKPYKTENISFL